MRQSEIIFKFFEYFLHISYFNKKQQCNCSLNSILRQINLRLQQSDLSNNIKQQIILKIINYNFTLIINMHSFLIKASIH